jgi:uncharacterized membrane protein YeaQ/YmgE (transglycosylase-associated protein family)
MWWIGSLIIGLLAGAIAGRLVEGEGFGCLGNIIVGLIGSLIGGWLFSQLNLSAGAGFWGSLITATIGAVALLVGINLLTGRRLRRR